MALQLLVEGPKLAGLRPHVISHELLQLDTRRLEARSYADHVRLDLGTVAQHQALGVVLPHTLTTHPHLNPAVEDHGGGALVNIEVPTLEEQVVDEARPVF